MYFLNKQYSSPPLKDIAFVYVYLDQQFLLKIISKPIYLLITACVFVKMANSQMLIDLMISDMLDKTISPEKIKQYDFLLDEFRSNLLNLNNNMYLDDGKRFSKGHLQAYSVPGSTPNKTLYYRKDILNKPGNGELTTGTIINKRFFYYIFIGCKYCVVYSFINPLVGSPLNVKQKPLEYGCMFLANYTEYLQVTLINSNIQNPSSLSCEIWPGNIQYGTFKPPYNSVISLITFFVEVSPSSDEDKIILQLTELQKQLKEIMVVNDQSQINCGNDKTKYCDSCLASDPKFCLECPREKVQTGGCGSCITDKCNKFKASFTKKSPTCKTTHCIDCSDEVPLCKKCNNTLVQVGNICTCQGNQFLNTTASDCQNCPNHCLQCNNSQHCLKCEEQYLLNVTDGSCINLLFTELAFIEKTQCNGTSVGLKPISDDSVLINELGSTCVLNGISMDNEQLVFQMRIEQSALIYCFPKEQSQSIQFTELICSPNLKFQGRIVKNTTLILNTTKIPDSSETNTTDTKQNSTAQSNSDMGSKIVQSTTNPIQTTQESLNSISDKHVSQAQVNNYSQNYALQLMFEQDLKNDLSAAKFTGFINTSYQIVTNRSTTRGEVISYAKYLQLWAQLGSFPYWLSYQPLLNMQQIYVVEATEIFITSWVFPGSKKSLYAQALPPEIVNPFNIDYHYNNTEISQYYSELGLSPVFLYSNNNVLTMLAIYILLRGLLMILCRNKKPIQYPQNLQLLMTLQGLTIKDKQDMVGVYSESDSYLRVLVNRYLFGIFDSTLLMLILTILIFFDHPAKEGRIEIVSLLIGIVYACIMIICQVFTYLKIHRITKILKHLRIAQPESCEDVIIKTRCANNFQLSDLRYDDSIGFFYHAINYCKKIVLPILVYKVKDSNQALIYMFIVEVIQMVFFFSTRPYLKKIKEILFSVFHICCVTLLYSKMCLNYETQMALMSYSQTLSTNRLSQQRSLGCVVVAFELMALSIPVISMLLINALYFLEMCWKRITQSRSRGVNQEIQALRVGSTTTQQAWFTEGMFEIAFLIPDTYKQDLFQ